MRTVTATEAAKGMGGLLHRANRGKVTLVTRNGHPVAALVPVNDLGDPIDRSYDTFPDDWEIREEKT